jgi:hypothetical protein
MRTFGGAITVLAIAALVYAASYAIWLAIGAPR